MVGPFLCCVSRELCWTAKTERAYLQVLADEACKQLAIRNDVINAQENNLQQVSGSANPIYQETGHHLCTKANNNDENAEL